MHCHEYNVSVVDCFYRADNFGTCVWIGSVSPETDSVSFPCIRFSVLQISVLPQEIREGTHQCVFRKIPYLVESFKAHVFTLLHVRFEIALVLAREYSRKLTERNNQEELVDQSSYRHAPQIDATTGHCVEIRMPHGRSHQ